MVRTPARAGPTGVLPREFKDQPLAEAFKNRFLEAVRTRTGVDLAAQCEHVPLPLAKVLYEVDTVPRYVHFMTSGLASIVAAMDSGTEVEVGMFGYEGFPETIHLLGRQTVHKRCMVQIGGSALRMDFGQFRRQFLQNEGIRDIALGLVQFENLMVSQIAACNGLHEVEERLARWLLMVEDRIGTPEMSLTQEFLSDMLGTRRSTVTITAGNLQRSGLIDYRRGLIRIERRDRLEEVACECYGVLKRLRENLYS